MDSQNEYNKLESFYNINKDEKIGDEFDDLIMGNINKFYKLKSEYEKNINSVKLNIIRNSTLSRKEKKKMYEKFQPKCIGCGCDGGSVFTSYKNENQDRILEAYCKCPSKCDFKININIGSYNHINDSIIQMYDELNAMKKKIIIHKNDLLFDVNKENNNDFKTLVSNLENLNSDYIAYSDHFINFNEKTINYEKVILNEKELNRIVNSFDDAMMSILTLKTLYEFQNNNLFIEGSLTYLNYYVCNYFLRQINIEINKMKSHEEYDDFNANNFPLKFKQKQALLNIKEIFTRIIKYKYSKYNLKNNEKTNEVNLINNFTNNMEINEGLDPKINDFIIHVKNNNTTQIKQRQKNKEILIENPNIEELNI